MQLPWKYLGQQTCKKKKKREEELVSDLFGWQKQSHYVACLSRLLYAIYVHLYHFIFSLIIYQWLIFQKSKVENQIKFLYLLLKVEWGIERRSRQSSPQIYLLNQPKIFILCWAWVCVSVFVCVVLRAVMTSPRHTCSAGHQLLPGHC